MVGLFHLNNKGSPARSARSTDTVRPHTPPPPYGPDSHEHTLVATATTTTTTVTTTTHTTTHFFSLPLWRRRTQLPHVAAPDLHRLAPDELGLIPRPGTPQAVARDKELPPTPPPEEDEQRVRQSLTVESRSSGLLRSGSAEDVRSPRNALMSQPPLETLTPFLPSSESGQTTVALARAALGLGLPPVLCTSTPESLSDVNSVNHPVPPRPAEILHTESLPPATLNRTKSTHEHTGSGVSDATPPVRERRRNRGLSLGPLLSNASPDEKGKGNQQGTESKPLSRKSSFWNRKRNDSRPLAPVNPPSPSHFLQLSSLPTLQPLSPFRVDDMGNDPSAAHAINSQVDLRRRHSERTHANSNPPYPEELPIAPQGQRRRRPNRPQTADTPSSPRAASAYFPHSIPLTSSPNELSSSPSERSEPSSVHGSSLRPRAQTNPPLLHRLSLNLFGSSTPSPSPVIPNAEPYNRSPSTSFSSSRPSLSRQSPKVSVEIPKPRYHEEEQPEIYVQRLMEAVSKAEVASVLAASADEFHTQALRSYLSQFDFNHDPLDVALRRLLMDVGLPRETQQIDRVMEAFAERYRHCHPNLFNSDDHPYILAFSLIMLHTDAFNKSNKKKMSKADYLKNTRLPGLAPEVLDCFYDNIVFAPFIFIEDPLDVNGQRGLMSEGPRRLSTLGGSPGVHNNNSTTLLGKGNKIDPYYLITRNLLDDLRVEIRPYIPLTSPYFYQGTAGRWDENKLLRAFAMARVVEIASEHRYAAPPWFGLNVGAGPSAGAMMAVPTFSGGPYDMVHLKVTKVGSLLRKDDVLEGGRKGNSRKWKEWSVLLTGSQLLFSRDPQWAQNIQSRVNGKDNVMALNQLSMSRPDEMYSVRDAVAVFDRSYTKHPSTLRLVMPDGRHILLQARDELEMNEWISCINYASAFKTAGVRMRSLGLSGKDIELTGHAAAVSHLRDLNRPQPSPRVHSYSGHAVDSVPSPQSLDYSRSPSEATFDEPLTPPMENPSRLFKATFDQVKADLASGNEPISDAVSIRSGHRPRAYSLDSVIQRPLSPTLKPPEENVTPRLSSRSQIIKRKVHDLDSRIAVQKSQLDSDMRFVRNIAILTPFQRSTRDRLQSAIQNVSKRIMQVRLDVEKLVCHRDVLVQDLAAEERDWQRTKKIALRAATQKLEIERKRSVPRMTLSMYVDGEMTESSPSDALRTPNLEDGRPHSAAADSYHTAIEFMPDSAGPEPEAARADASLSLDLSTSMSLADLSISSSSPLIESPRPPLTSVRMSTESGTPGGTEEHSISHEQFYTASETLEEAEDWNKTRAAKRVSLVRVPSTLKLFSPKHGRDFSQVLSEDSGTTVTPDNLYRTRSTPYEPPLRTHSYSDSASLSHL